MSIHEKTTYMNQEKGDEIITFIDAVVEEFKSQNIPKEEWPPIHYSFVKNCINRERSPKDAAWALLQ